MGWAGPVARLASFFDENFFLFLPAKQIKQIQNKTKFDQTKFVEFRKINSTTIVTTNNKWTKIILVK